MRKMNRHAGWAGGFLFSPRLAAYALAACFLVLASPSAALETKADFAILVDMTTGRVLFEKNADQPMQPASMTKMMTVYMLFERLRDGSLSLEGLMDAARQL